MNKVRGFELVSEEQFIKDFVEDFETSKNEAKEIYKGLKLPKRATARSAGYDVFSPIDFTLEPNQDIKLPTGFKVYMLEDEWIGFLPRSGHGFKYYIRLANTEGVGDSDYYNNKGNEGHYFIKLRNEGNKTLAVKKGEAISQAIFNKYLLIDGDDFVGEERKGGFGSTSTK